MPCWVQPRNREPFLSISRTLLAPQLILDFGKFKSSIALDPRITEIWNSHDTHPRGLNSQNPRIADLSGGPGGADAGLELFAEALEYDVADGGRYDGDGEVPDGEDVI